MRQGGVMDLGTVGDIARWQASTTARMPGSSLLDDKTYMERAIPAGSSHPISVRGLFEGKHCVISTLLHPVAGQDDELEFSWGGGQCRLLAYAISQSSKGAAKLLMRQEKTPPGTKGSS